MSGVSLAIAGPVVAGLLTAGGGGGGAFLSCYSERAVACGLDSCEESLVGPMGIAVDAARLEYCIGESCYAARIKPIKAGQEVLFAFNAKKTAGGNGHVSGLVTLHAGRTAATLGHFYADGTVSFSRMVCGG